MLNRIVLIGRLVRDPELRYTSNGVAVANFTLAVERNFTNAQGERDVDFIDIVVWRKQGETCAHHLGKGRLVAVEGRLQIRKNKKKNRTYINPEVIADDVRFLDWPDDNQGNQNRGGNNYQGNQGNYNQGQGNYQGGNQNQDPGGPPPDYEPDDDEFDVPF